MKIILEIAGAMTIRTIHRNQCANKSPYLYGWPQAIFKKSERPGSFVHNTNYEEKPKDKFW